MKISDSIVREIIMNYFRIVDARKFDELIKVFHPEVIYERPTVDHPIVGLDNLLQFYKKDRVLASGYHEVYKLVVENNICVCEGRFIGHDKDGNKVNERFADIFEFQDGLVKNRVTYFYKPAV